MASFQSHLLQQIFMHYFSPKRKQFEFDLVHLQGRMCSQIETCSFTTPNNVGIKSFPSVRRKNGFHSANINYRVWTWQHIAIFLFTTNVILIDIVIIKREKKQINPPTSTKMTSLYLSINTTTDFCLLSPKLEDNVSAPRKI